jgi:hypothetical protein
MKKLMSMGILMFAGAFLFFTLQAQAHLLAENVNVVVNSQGPKITANFPTAGTQSPDGRYALTISGAGQLDGVYDAVCVEDIVVINPFTANLYTLDQIEYQGYFEAAWIYDNYIGTYNKVDIQAAAWEVALDLGNYNIAAGSFTTNDGDLNAGNIGIMLAAVDAEDLTDQSSAPGWILVSDIADTTAPEKGGDIADLGDSQDFIIKRVPEPATMLLLGASLLGLVGLGRKKFLRKG